MSVTATASNSTTTTARYSRRPEWHCVGENPHTGLVEVVEIPGKRWFLGTQYHPEYSSTVLNPNPLFLSFVSAAISYNAEKAEAGAKTEK